MRLYGAEVGGTLVNWPPNFVRPLERSPLSADSMAGNPPAAANGASYFCFCRLSTVYLAIHLVSARPLLQIAKGPLRWNFETKYNVVFFPCRTAGHVIVTGAEKSLDVT